MKSKNILSKQNTYCMKTIYFNIQAKGGTGKSMLTYLQALKHEDNAAVCFVDLDSSTFTSKRQLKFVGVKNSVFQIDIFDRLKKIEREKLFQILEALSAYQDFTQVYIDFGAPESEQLPGLFSIDFSIDEFKEFETGLQVKFVFNIILAGGTAYVSTFNYLKKMLELVNGRFEINVYANSFTFHNHEHLIDELKTFATKTKGLVKRVVSFGDIHADRSSGQMITANVTEGKGMDGYHSFAARTIIKREIAKL
jgi:hypothetical protein